MSNIQFQNYPNAFNDIPGQVKIRQNTVETYAYKNVPQRRVLVNVNPSSAIATNILQGAQIDYRLESGVIDRIGGAGVQLRVAYSNTSGANCVIAIPEAWLANVQIYSNNGFTLLYQHVNEVEQFLINSVTLSRNEHENTAAYRGTLAAYATGTLTIANNQSGYLFVNIAPLFWKSIHLRPYSVERQLLVRLTFNPAFANISSGSMTTTEAVLRVSGYEESDAQKKMILSKAMLPKNVFYYAPQRHIKTQTLAASSTYTIRLSGIHGMCNQLFFVLRAVANIGSPSNEFSFARASSFEILDESGVSQTGFTPVTESDMIMQYGHQYDNIFINNTNAHVWSFSQTPVADLKHGTSNGSFFFNGFASLRFTTSSTFTPGSYQFMCVALCNENLRVVKGNVSTTRS
jgi:hypothetical protein